MIEDDMLPAGVFDTGSTTNGQESFVEGGDRWFITQEEIS
jgi:hypothetical protein